MLIPQSAQPKFNLWIEVGGQVALSIWRVSLLAAVAETGSITKAAVQLEVPYRVAWQKIHEMEELLGQKLTETQTGGSGGGGTILTPLAQAYVDKFASFQQLVEPFLLTQFQELFVSSSLE